MVGKLWWQIVILFRCVNWCNVHTVYLPVVYRSVFNRYAGNQKTSTITTTIITRTATKTIITMSNLSPSPVLRVLCTTTRRFSKHAPTFRSNRGSLRIVIMILNILNDRFCARREIQFLRYTFPSSQYIVLTWWRPQQPMCEPPWIHVIIPVRLQYSVCSITDDRVPTDRAFETFNTATFVFVFDETKWSRFYCVVRLFKSGQKLIAMILSHIFYFTFNRTIIMLSIVILCIYIYIYFFYFQLFGSLQTTTLLYFSLSKIVSFLTFYVAWITTSDPGSL